MSLPFIVKNRYKQPNTNLDSIKKNERNPFGASAPRMKISSTSPAPTSAEEKMSSLHELHLDILKCLKTTAPKLDHVLPGLLAGTVGALIAPGGVGKTMLLTQIGCAIATGNPILGGTVVASSLAPGKVVIFLAEESAAVMHHRIQGAAAALVQEVGMNSPEQRHEFAATLKKNLHIYPLNGNTDLARIDKGENSFQQIAELCADARLVIFDPLRQFHDGDENDSGAMSTIVRYFQRLARETNAAVILAHHANRVSTATATGDLSSASRGSTALTDGVRWQANLSVPTGRKIDDILISESDALQLVQLDIAKTNYSRLPLPVLLRKNEESGTMSFFCRTARKIRKSPGRFQNKEAN